MGLYKTDLDLLKCPEHNVNLEIYKIDNYETVNYYTLKCKYCKYSAWLSESLYNQILGINKNFSLFEGDYM